MPSAARRLRVAVVEDHEVAVRGLATLLADEQVDVVALDRAGLAATDADLVLYDPTLSRPDGADADLPHLAGVIRDSPVPVVAYSWGGPGHPVDDAMDAGCVGYLAKELGATLLASALVRIRDGERVVITHDPEAVDSGTGQWAGRDAGLSRRESEIVALIARGWSNTEIAESTYLSINSVKSYIRSAYHKMEVTRRSQAVRWAVQHGFSTDDEAASSALE